MKLQDFIDAECLKADVTYIANRTDGMMSDMPRHFKVWIYAPNSIAPLVVEFSQGNAHTKAPTLADVLECLATDAMGVINTPLFQHWADEYGYAVDSRKAENIFNAVQEQTDNLRALLGPDAFNQLISGEIEF